MEHPKCAAIDEIFYYDSRPPLFALRLQKIDAADFRRLYRCRVCGQHWRIDEWDKYQVQLAVKINNPESWREFDSARLENELLIRHRGGLSATDCAWAACGSRAVNGVALCAKHLREAGVRR